MHLTRSTEAKACSSRGTRKKFSAQGRGSFRHRTRQRLRSTDPQTAPEHANLNQNPAPTPPEKLPTNLVRPRKNTANMGTKHLLNLFLRPPTKKSMYLGASDPRRDPPGPSEQAPDMLSMVLMFWVSCWRPCKTSTALAEASRTSYNKFSFAIPT